MQAPETAADALLDMMRAAARMIAAGEALLFAAAGNFAMLREAEAVEDLRRIRASGGRRLWDLTDADRWAADEVAAVLSVSSATAGRRLDDGERLVTAMPAALAALAGGEVDAARVRAVLDATRDLDPQLAGEVCDSVLAVAPGRTAGEVRRLARREVVRRAPQVADERYARARRARQAQVWPDEVPGMACLQVTGPADRVAAAWQAATAVALERVEQDRIRQDCERLTLDQARADAVLDLITGLGDPSEIASSPDVHVTVLVPPDGVVALAGHGPLPPAAAAALGTVTRITTAWTDASGTVTAVDASRGYVPAPRLAATVRARDQSCRFPGCTRVADRCDLDHVRPWPAGATEAANLAALCRRHHRLKTHSRWRVRALPDGVLEWTSPAGHTHVTEPPRWIPRGPAVNELRASPASTGTRRVDEAPPF